MPRSRIVLGVEPRVEAVTGLRLIVHLFWLGVTGTPPLFARRDGRMVVVKVTHATVRGVPSSTPRSVSGASVEAPPASPLAPLQRLLSPPERELQALDAPWSLLELSPARRRQFSLTLTIGRIEGISLESSPAELGPQLRTLLRRRRLPCPTCRTPQDLFRCPPTWTCACGTTFSLCPLRPDDPGWEALLEQTERLIPEALRDAVLDAIDHGDSGPEDWCAGVTVVHPFEAATQLYTVTPEAAFPPLSTLPPQLVLQLASSQLGARVDSEAEELPSPAWQMETPEGPTLQWRLEPELQTTLVTPTPSTGSWDGLTVHALRWTDPLPPFATLEEATTWLGERLKEAMARGSEPPPPAASSPGPQP